MTVYVHINWQTVRITEIPAPDVAASVRFPPIAYSVADSGRNAATAVKSAEKYLLNDKTEEIAVPAITEYVQSLVHRSITPPSPPAKDDESV